MVSTQIRLAAAAFIAGAIMSSGASAQVLLSDNFNGENGGNSSLNYSAFANWDVNGQVDLIRSGIEYSITCFGGSGSCVDVDGSSGPGRMTTKNAFSFAIGDVMRFEFMFSGNQRGGGADDITWGVEAFGGSFGHAGFNFAENDASFLTSGPATLSTSTFAGRTPGSSTPWTKASLQFTATTAGSAKFFFYTTSGDNFGPIVDNAVVTRNPTSVVPEPSTYALMAAGLAALGVGARRKRVS